MRCRVRGTFELGNWLLGFGPHVEVLAPPELRARINETLGAGRR